MNATPLMRARWLGAAALALAVVGCSGGAKTTSSTSTSALSAAYASSTAASGTLLCTPSDAQTAACTGLAAGAACTLTAKDGTTPIDGTCRATFDGTGVACAPNPPAPPQELVTPCASLAAGAACTVTEEFGETRSGVCVTARDGTTLICGRVHTPPQSAVDACTGKAAGDACTNAEDDEDDHDEHEGDTDNGVCSLGPAGTGPLACAHVHALLPHGAEACAGLTAGAACTMGREDQVSGTCMTPSGETTLVCVVACADLHGRFECRSDGSGGDPGHHGR